MQKLLLGGLLCVIAASAVAESPWSGSYVGIIAGPAWGTYDMKQSTVPGGYIVTPESTAAVNQAGKQTMHPKGFEAGIEAGYNWQRKNLLLGVETDLQGLNFSDSAQSAAIPYPTHPEFAFNVGSFANNNWLLTLRPRIGFITNDCLVYATGGLGLTKINSNYYFTDEAEALISGSINTVKPGYTLGAGLEYKLTPRFSIKAEYIYVNFSSTNATTTGNNILVTNPDQIFKYSERFNASFIRIGINYHLD